MNAWIAMTLMAPFLFSALTVWLLVRRANIVEKQRLTEQNARGCCTEQ